MLGCYLGEDEAVVVGVTGVFRSVLHGMKEKHRHDLCHAATWCGMTAVKQWREREESDTDSNPIQKIYVPSDSSGQIWNKQNMFQSNIVNAQTQGVKVEIRSGVWLFGLIHVRVIVVRELCNIDSRQTDFISIRQSLSTYTWAFSLIHAHTQIFKLQRYSVCNPKRLKTIQHKTGYNCIVFMS